MQTEATVPPVFAKIAKYFCFYLVVCLLICIFAPVNGNLVADAA
jgi:hypothetical protein